jgi:hypothetical protein
MCELDVSTINILLLLDFCQDSSLLPLSLSEQVHIDRGREGRSVLEMQLVRS